MRLTLSSRFSILLLLLLQGASAALLAQESSGHPCAAVALPSDRLACYDKAFPPLPHVIEAAAERARADFGLKDSRESLRNPGQEDAQADPESIKSRVAKVDYGRNGQRSFELENGQVWILTEAGSSGHVRADDVVQVRRGTLAGYVLVTPGSVALRVRRLR